MRKTKQKNMIFQVLENNYNHPTINDIFNECCKKDSSIGIATIYRNVDNLVLKGKLNKFVDYNNVVRYDPILTNHSHFICENCQKIYDIDYFDSNSYLKNKNISSISNVNLFLNGTCNKCEK